MAQFIIQIKGLLVKAILTFSLLFPGFVFVSGIKWGYLFLLYVFIQVSRFIVVGTLFPLLRYFGYGLDVKEATILIWSGLRGAVALSLSLSVKVSHFFSCLYHNLLFYFVVL